uniref:Uncharacterized protein n=1 Tax=Attheya septentrionalis TaxID=420275 RepID=A0A7S2UG53_9STRA|mmetsp:Transcript_24213/g.43759  ORF Transcript_24213/g.43759 Transcript_24213/m.43759 type:complete len:778 (+) Transcript_24213:376-2709(+)
MFRLLRARRLEQCFLTGSHPHRMLSTTKRSAPAISKVLIANRGEIACRVMRTCHRLGIPTVALYSETGDGPTALHAQMADEAYPIGIGPSPMESYLRASEVLEIAERSGAKAIHPGYGFLSENASFAELVKASPADIAFVGPPADAILAMGSKSHSKALMIDAGVPTTPGYHGSNQDPDYLKHEAVTNIGFPLLIKATMGGGGKGMRLVLNEHDFLPSLESCKRESIAAFGDDNVILERFLIKPRHIEVQVVADQHGNVLHLHERDCSLQRRHQKIIEEAPASDLPKEMLEKMGDMAKRAAQAVGYVSAGTVEFLLDPVSQEFYFCEMNTRLQVEHPVTELITGIDLVEWQLRIAAGEVLPITDQADVPRMGHAMEARIYAENPARDFLPATGTVWHHEPPAESNTGINVDTGVRVDTGIKTGDEIGVHYDPMISKLIVYGSDRDDAIQKLVTSLKQYQIAGVPTNIPFLVKCAQHPAFQTAGDINTGFLDDHAEDVRVDSSDPVAHETALTRAIAAFCVLLHTEKRIGVDGNLHITQKRLGTPWSNLMGSWRMGGNKARFMRTLILADEADPDNSKIECLSNPDGSFEISVHSRVAEMECSGDGDETIIDSYTISGTLSTNNCLNVVINGTKRISCTAVIYEDELSDAPKLFVNMWVKNHLKESGVDYAWSMALQHPLLVNRSQEASTQVGSGSVKAPMPGKITKVHVVEGQKVLKSDILIVMEAMKMEHTIRAPSDGTVVSLLSLPGEIVKDGDILVLVEDANASTVLKDEKIVA